MRGISLQVRLISQDGLPSDDLVRAGRAMVGLNGSLHTAKVVRAMINPFHKDIAVWQTADGQFLYHVKVWCELSEPIPGNALV